MATKKPVESTLFDIQPIIMATTVYYLLGTSPLIMNRFAQKAKQELLFPETNKKNKAARAESLKHDPLAEYRESMYRNRSDAEPTLLHFPQGAFRKAMAWAALDLPGASKSEILRLVSLDTLQINMYGVPMLGMDMVRSSNAARTPDVRTRAYLPQWCCEIPVSYSKSNIGPVQVLNLLQAAGHIVGLGDYRPQKGGGYGRFITVDKRDPRYLLVQKQARAAQEEAWQTPEFFDDETSELYAWFIAEVERREKTTPSSVEPIAGKKRKTINGKRKLKIVA